MVDRSGIDGGITAYLYTCDKFLACFPGLTKDKLLLYAALYGNNFVNSFSLDIALGIYIWHIYVFH